MTKVLITESYLEDIADSIRAKNGTENMYKPSEMAEAIDAISGGSANLEEKTVSPSETPIVVRPSTGYDGMSRVNVNAISDEYVGSMVPRITSLTITDGNVTAPSGYYPNAISDSVVSGTKQISITQNGTTTENVAIYASAEITVNVSSSSPTLQTKTVTPTESTQTVTPDSGYDGLSQVTVNPIPSSYVQPSGSLSITTNDTYNVSQYASAVVNVSGGGGSSGGTEVTVTTAKTNASACIKEIIPSLQNRHVYIGCIKNKSVSNFVTDQLIAFVTYIDNQNTNGGGCLRYRNSSFASAGTAVTYDAKIEVGDVYVYYDFDFSS